jgi:murein DD-endopeptidase MepM/ murein hydrolase activator NlpD
LIKQNGSEVRVRSFAAPDVPGLRRGDKVIVRARALDDTYIVKSVTRDPLARQMFLEVTDPDEHEVHVDFDAMGLWTWEPPEDEVDGGHSAGGGAQSKAGWQWPVSGPITSGFGPRGNDFHYGLDIGAGSGTPVSPGKPGRVALAGVLSGYGNVIYVDHGSGYSSRYAHLSSMAVGAGAQVGYNSMIGRVGATGNATGPHLHFEVRRGGEAINPLSVLP